MAPPASESRTKCFVAISLPLVHTAVSLVNKQCRHATGSTVKIFVAAPRRKINVPVMEPQIHVPRGMGAVPTDQYAFGVGVSGNLFNIKVLSGVELDGREKNQCSTRGVVINDFENLFRCQNGGVCIFWLNQDHGIIRGKIVVADLRFDRILYVLELVWCDNIYIPARHT